jgi:hypothetical protein
MTTLLSVINGTRQACLLARQRRMLSRLKAIATTPTSTPTAGPTPPAIPSTGRIHGKTTYVSRQRVPEITIERLKRRAASFCSSAGLPLGAVEGGLVVVGVETASVGLLTSPRLPHREVGSPIRGHGLRAYADDLDRSVPEAFGPVALFIDDVKVDPNPIVESCVMHIEFIKTSIPIYFIGAQDLIPNGGHWEGIPKPGLLENHKFDAVGEFGTDNIICRGAFTFGLSPNPGPGETFFLYRFTEDQSGTINADGLTDAFEGQQFTWHVVTTGNAPSAPSTTSGSSSRVPGY